MADLERTGYNLVIDGGDTFKRILEQAVAVTNLLTQAGDKLAGSFVVQAENSKLVEAAINQVSAALLRGVAQETLYNQLIEQNIDEELAQAASAKTVAAAIQQAQAQANAAAQEQIRFEQLKASETAKYAAQRIADENSVVANNIKSAQQSAAVFNEAIQSETVAWNRIIALEEQEASHFAVLQKLKADEQAKYAAQRIADENAVTTANIKSAQASAAVFREAFAVQEAALVEVKAQQQAATEWYIAQERLKQAEIIKTAQIAEAEAAKQAAIQARANSTVTGVAQKALGGSFGLSETDVATITKFASSIGLATTGVGLLAAAGVALSGVLDALKSGFNFLIGVIQNVLNVLVDLAQKGFEYVTKVITDYQNTVQTAAAITAIALGVIVAGSVDLAAKYQNAMNIVRTYSSISASSVEELNANMVALDKVITQIGTTTTVSMLTAAQASEDLVKAGVDVRTQTEGALKAVTDLTIASAGELKAADAALAVAQGLHTYNLEGNEATRVTNSIAVAAQLSNASFTQVTTALKYLGPEAHNARMSIEETAAAITILGERGIVGSIAGTNLRQMLVSLEKPSQTAIKVLDEMHVSLFTAAGAIRPFADVIQDLSNYLGTSATSMNKALGIMEQYNLTTVDATGHMKPYAQIVDEVTAATGENAKALLGVTDAQRLFNLETAFTVRGAHAAAVLIDEGAESFRNLTKTAQEAGLAELLAAELMQPLDQRLTIAKNGIEALGIQLGSGFLGILSAATNGVITFLQSWDISTLQLIGQTVQALVFNSGFDQLKDKIGQAFPPEVSARIQDIIEVMRLIANVISSLILPALGELKDQITQPFENATAPRNFASALNDVKASIINVAIEITKIINYITELVNVFNTTSSSGRVLKDIIVGLIGLALAPLITIVVGATAAFITLIAVAYAVGLAMLGDAQATDEAGQGWNDFLSNLQPVFPALANLIKSIGILASDIATFVTSWIDAARNIASAFLSAAGVVIGAVEKMSGALMHSPDAAVAAMATATNAAAKAAQSAMDSTSGAASVIGKDIADVGAAIKATAAEVQNIHLDIPTNMGGTRELPDFLKQALDAVNNTRAGLTGLTDDTKKQGEAARTAAGPNENFAKELNDTGKAAKKAADEIKALEKALDSAQDSMDKAGRTFNESIDKITQSFNDKMQKAADEAMKQAVDAATNAAKQIADIDTNTYYSRLNRAIKQGATEYFQSIEDQVKSTNDELEQGLKTFIDNERQRRKEGYQDSERALKESLDKQYQLYTQAGQDRVEALRQALATQSQLEKQHEADSVSALGNTQSKEEATLKREQQLRLDNIKKAQELAAAKTPEERARIEQQFSNQQQVQQQQYNDELALQSLKERHAAQKRTLEQQNAQADLVRQQANTTQVKNLEQSNAIDNKNEKERLDGIYNAKVRTDKELEFTLEQNEDKALHRQKLDDEKKLTETKRTNRLALQALDDTLEDMANERRKQSIRLELKDRLAAIALAYVGKTEDIANMSAEQIAAAAQTLNDKLNDANKQFMDQVEAHADAGGDIQAQFVENFNTHMHDLQVAADETTKAINAMIAAANAANNETVGPAVTAAQPNPNAVGIKSPQTSVPTGGSGTFGGLPVSGGAVPYAGNFSPGSVPSAAVQAAQGVGPSAPSAAPATATPASAGSVVNIINNNNSGNPKTTTINNHFDVHASYSDTQSPSSIANDMGALAAIAGGS